MGAGANPSYTDVSLASPYEQASGAQAGAITGTAEAMNFTPTQVKGTSYTPTTNLQGTTFDAAMQSNPQAAAALMKNYMNPYTSDVIDASMKKLGAAQQQSLIQGAAQANAAKAFGGDRHGIADAQTRLGYGDQAANMTANLYNQGFNTALGAAQFDVGQQQAVNAANQAAQNAARQFGANTAFQAGQINQGAINAANQFGATQDMTAQQLNQMAALQANQQKLAGANQLGNLGQQSFNYGQTIQNQQNQYGLQQEQMMQALIDAAQGNFGQQTGAPQGAQTFLSMLFGAPPMQGQNTSFQPGLFNYLQLGANMFG